MHDNIRLVVHPGFTDCEYSPPECHAVCGAWRGRGWGPRRL